MTRAGRQPGTILHTWRPFRAGAARALGEQGPAGHVSAKTRVTMSRFMEHRALWGEGRVSVIHVAPLLPSVLLSHHPRGSGFHNAWPFLLSVKTQCSTQGVGVSCQPRGWIPLSLPRRPSPQGSPLSLTSKMLFCSRNFTAGPVRPLGPPGACFLLGAQRLPSPWLGIDVGLSPLCPGSVCTGSFRVAGAESQRWLRRKF